MGQVTALVMNEHYAPLFYREIIKIAERTEQPLREQVLALGSLLERLFFEATKQEQIAFSSLFARISYVGHQFHFQEDTLRAVHGFRLSVRRVRMGSQATSAQVWLGVRSVAESVLLLTRAAMPEDLLRLLGEHPSPTRLQPAHSIPAQDIRCIRVLAVEDRPAEQLLLARQAEQPEQIISIRYGLPERNAHFSPTLQIIRKVFGFPVSLNLLDVAIDAQGHYLPRTIVVEPDYLMDVSAVADCFKDSGPEPYSYLCRKFLPYEVTEPILLGNIANFFLDRLLNEPDCPWKTLFLETFQAYPFVYAPMTDTEVRSISGKAQKHYINLKNMAAGGFAKQGIAPQHCVLEPTFFSEQYGLQGRLDLFYHHEGEAAIVELKSGIPYKPNNYGIQRSHFTQTLLYDLLVRSVFGHATDPAKYILYSSADQNQLRFAPTVAPEQWEALQVRNQLVAIERLLTQIQPGDEVVPAFSRLKIAQAKGGYTKRDFALFEAAYTPLSAVEKKYFNAFVGFIAREHWLAKIGEENSDIHYGHANLWRSSLEDKSQAFSILSGLELIENQADRPEPLLVFRKTTATHPLANFRVGDIAVLYPAAHDEDTVLNHQVIKCTITELSPLRVVVQLRFRQFNLKPFDTERLWCLEPDTMDMGFAAMYRSLFEWACAKQEVRQRVLGAHGPAHKSTGHEQQAGAGRAFSAENAGQPSSTPLLSCITSSPHFYLLWGPPGTGKTSVMLRDLAAWVLQHTDDNLLLLAYTNRAADEICEALDSLGGNIRQQYIRIGNRHAVAARFGEQLLGTKIKEANTRSELRKVLEHHRIFVSTVASFSQNEGLLRLKKFQRLVVDEASQILEPQLVGLLTRFDHFVLIGDHRQLPAVTAQRAESTQVQDADLRGIGLSDLRDSYFERLYRRCQQEGWHWAYGQLERQGRMHADIMDFPARSFYGERLLTLTDDPADRQHRPLAYPHCTAQSGLEKVLCERRVVFLPTPGEDALSAPKTNRAEARQIAHIALFFKNLYAANGLDWHPARTLGIITPWRAQIAQIKTSLAELGLDPDEISTDTVERYQGGAREIILVSTCVNSPYQLGSLVNLSHEGIDRKLNVALTRAREHLIVLGNEVLLRQNEHYRAFIEAYRWAEE